MQLLAPIGSLMVQYSPPDVSMGSSPLIPCPALWLKLCRCIEQPAQEITVPKEVLNNCVAARFKHTCYYACDLQCPAINCLQHPSYNYRFPTGHPEWHCCAANTLQHDSSIPGLRIDRAAIIVHQGHIKGGPASSMRGYEGLGSSPDGAGWS